MASSATRQLLTLLLSAACAAFTYRFFGEAFPITSLSITADQHDVRAAARTLRAELNASAEVRPVEGAGEEWREASSFKLDSACQHFVELRGGGNAAFSRMLSESLYAPFTWRVRHFRPGDAAETLYFFRPDGAINGFTTTLPEDELAANLTAESALETAKMTAASRPWSIDFAEWALVEQQREAKPRRADHTFTFERAEKVGEPGSGEEASYRLTLRVSGSRLSSVRRSFKVPETFERSFDGMRSANEALAQLAWIGIVVVYGVVGVVGGSFYLLRRKQLAAASALPWAALLAGGAGGAVGVTLPLAWMSYSTEVDVRVFGLDFGVKCAVNTAFLFAVTYLSFVAAEGLTRCAFPAQLRLWALMRRAVLASAEAREQVVLGYLLVPVLFAYEVSFYFLCKHLLGWWMPSSPLADPDVNATLAPWVFCVAQALFAGFWEEALFRAVPLAAARLAARGRARVAARVGCVVGAFALQACLFGAAHANYPAQPAHARLVELIVPSVGFGALYWRCGLLPGVVLHFCYDVVWMALPIFLSDANELDKALVVLTTSLPLLAVCGARLLVGAPPSTAAKREAQLAPHRNNGWKPAAPAAAAGAARLEPQPKMAPARAAGVACGGAACLAAWLLWLLSPSVGGAPHASAHAHCYSWADGLGATAQQSALLVASQQPSAVGPGASADVASLGAMLEADAADAAAAPGGVPAHGAGALRAMPRLRPLRSEWLQHRFVWATLGREAYAPLLASGFLRGAEWEVRYARVGENATLAAAAGAEEWLVSGIGPHGGAAHNGTCADAHVARVTHTLPEARPGAEMSEEAARRAAHAALGAIDVEVVDTAVSGGDGDGNGVAAAAAARAAAACARVRESDSRAIAHPNRTDYAFNFSCLGDGFGLDAVGAEARFGLLVGAGEAGPLVLRLRRFVRVPEEWLRSDKTHEKICGVAQLASRVLLLLALGLAAVRGIVAWSSAGASAGAVSVSVSIGRAFRRATCGLLLLLGGAAANGAPLFVFGLATAQPYTNQLVSHVGGATVSIAMRVSLLAPRLCRLSGCNARDIFM